MSMIDCKEIYIDVPRWYIRPQSSDWRMRFVLANELQEINFRIPHGHLFALVYNVDKLIMRFLPRFVNPAFRRLCAYIRGILLRHEGATILLTQGEYPPMPKGVRIIWETYFLEPQNGDGRKTEEFVRGGKDRWCQQIEKYAQRASIIAVRGMASVNLLQKMYPEYTGKIANLHFVQPEYHRVSLQDVLTKQRKTNVEILFVGRWARHKGLCRLIDALCQLQNEKVNNFTLRIVSNFRDGFVDIPKCSWINVQKEVSHDEVLEIFKKSQVFVMPSKFESYGLVYLEALSAGCVTFVRDGEPQQEFIDYGNAGVAIDPFSPVDIASKLKPILLDHALRERLAINGVCRYNELFSQEKIRKAWVDWMNKI